MPYKCIKCNYETNIFRNIKNHANIKKNCIKNFNIIELTNDEILIYTLISDYKNKNLDTDKLKTYCYTYKNKQKLFEDIDYIDKYKDKCCKYCNTTFNKLNDLKEHIIIDCFEKYMENIDKCNDEKNKNNINKIQINENNISGNSININNNNNITNIILNITNPKEFDNSWDISQINESDKTKIILSKYMYTFLLDKILDNNENLNVIIDKDSNLGIVYKNNIQKYIKMEIEEIMNKSMDKLYENLLEISSELKKKDYYDNYLLDYKDKEIKNKYHCYKNNLDTNKTVNKRLTDMYDNIKKESHKIMKEYLINNKINNEIDNGF
jgi:hypothetical protein